LPQLPPLPAELVKRLEQIRSHPIMVQQAARLRELKEWTEKLRAAGVLPVPVEPGARDPSPPAPPAKPRRRRGPRKGDARYAADDRRHFKKLGQLIRKGRTLYGAALEIAKTGVLAGVAEPVSKAKRLAERYKNFLKLSETR
jgi:hypothetical protein